MYSIFLIFYILFFNILAVYFGFIVIRNFFKFIYKPISCFNYISKMKVLNMPINSEQTFDNLTTYDLVNLILKFWKNWLLNKFSKSDNSVVWVVVTHGCIVRPGNVGSCQSVTTNTRFPSSCLSDVTVRWFAGPHSRGFKTSALESTGTYYLISATT